MQTLLLTALLLLPAVPQNPDDHAGAQEAAFSVAYVHPENMSAEDLASFASQLYHVNNVMGEWVHREGLSIMALGEAVMIAAPAQRLDNVVEIVRRTDAEARRPKRKSLPVEVVTHEYRAKHVTLEAIHSSLEPFRRNVLIHGSGGSDSYRVDNMAFVAERNAVVLRDKPAAITEMVAVLESVDVAQPQVLVTYYLLQGRDGETDGGIPQDLVRDLSRLVPQDQFGLISFGMLRSAVLARMDLRDNISPSGTFSLSLEPEAYDQVGGTLSLRECKFQLVRERPTGTAQHSFTTRAAIGLGEYTVLGGLGAEPYYLVLRLQQL